MRGTTGTDAREIQALLELKAAPGLGDRGIWKLIQTHGSGIRALQHLRTQTQLWDSVSGVVEDRRPRHRHRPSASPLPITSPRFPPRLQELSDPPPLLFLRGREELLHRPAVAVVGARKATEVGRRTAEALGRVLGRAGLTVVSGMALGIDGAAHRGALEAGGDTVAVLGSGLGVVYPPSHRTLFRAIGQDGLLVSEFLPTEGAKAHHFPRRNRIIAALAHAVVVVEAGERSGAFITVDHGLDLGREIFAFPGSVENPRALGSNRLLREGARILTSPQGILEEIPDLVARAAQGRTSPEADVGPGPGAGLPEELRVLWAALAQEPREVDQVAREAGLALHEALAGLSALEVMGRIRRCPGMRFRRG